MCHRGVGSGHQRGQKSTFWPRESRSSLHPQPFLLLSRYWRLPPSEWYQLSPVIAGVARGWPLPGSALCLGLLREEVPRRGAETSAEPILEAGREQAQLAMVLAEPAG